MLTLGLMTALLLPVAESDASRLAVIRAAPDFSLTTQAADRATAERGGRSASAKTVLPNHEIRADDGIARSEARAERES
jgi:hypothetical protein